MRLAQLDRAFGYGPKGRGFESSNARCKTKRDADASLFCFRSGADATNPGSYLRSASVGARPRSTGPCAPSNARCKVRRDTFMSQEIINKLVANNVTAECKSLYDDMHSLMILESGLRRRSMERSITEKKSNEFMKLYSD